MLRLAGGRAWILRRYGRDDRGYSTLGSAYPVQCNQQKPGACLTARLNLLANSPFAVERTEYALPTLPGMIENFAFAS